jgi:hypothetical protein
MNGNKIWWLRWWRWGLKERTYQAEALKVAEYMPTATHSINRSPMALPIPGDQVQLRAKCRKVRRGQSSSVFMWANSEWPREKNQQSFSFVPHWQGCRNQWGYQGGGISPKPSREPRPSQPFFPPRLMEGLKPFSHLEGHWQFVYSCLKGPISQNHVPWT